MDVVNCVIEIPQGSRNKYEWDPDLRAIKLDRFLFSSVMYPIDYGFVPQTTAEDGDPLDAMVCVSEPTFPGCVIPARPIALFRMSDEKGPDDKLVCVPCDDPNWSHVQALDDLSEQLRSEISHFFAIYKQPEDKPVDVGGWHPLEEGLRVLAAARDAFNRAENEAAGLDAVSPT